MSDEHSDSGETIPEEEIDTGEPIQALADLQVEASVGFFRRLRRRIERKVLASDLAELSWSAPVMVLLEWISLAYGLIARTGRDAGERGK